MKKTIKQIQFDNQSNPKSYFDIVRIEDLLHKQLDHDIGKHHLVQFYIIFFVTAGAGYHTIDFTDYKYKKGTVLLIRKDQIQKFFRSSTVRGYLLIFTEEFIVSHMNKLEALKSLQLFNELLSFPKLELQPDNQEFSNFATLIDHLELEYSIKDEYSTGITRSVLHIMITKLFRIKSANEQLFAKKKYLEEFLAFQEMVEQNCFNSKKVADYARKMGFSSKTLNNIVQAIVHKPAKTFIDEIAIMQIKRLLISTSQPIKEIAYTAGFDDPTNFFKFFKKYVGSPPAVFRQAHQ
ncbi:MAG: helix-turn-helix transcriptional regulator [Bacteroidota bacterium]